MSFKLVNNITKYLLTWLKSSELAELIDIIIKAWYLRLTDLISTLVSEENCLYPYVLFNMPIIMPVKSLVWVLKLKLEQNSD